MMKPENGHRAHGFSSVHFLDSDEIIRELDLRGDEVFMDAGCGDGHNAIKILEDYNHKGLVYAVDVYDASIEDMQTYKDENDVENLINIEADITDGIPGVDDESVDVILMVNVFHGFKASRKLDEAVKECISKNILAEFLSKHRKEVKLMCLTEFNEQKYTEMIRGEGEAVGDSKRLIKLVESFASKHNVSIEEACEELSVEVSEYKEAQSIMLENA